MIPYVSPCRNTCHVAGTYFQTNERFLLYVHGGLLCLPVRPCTGLRSHGGCCHILLQVWHVLLTLHCDPS